MATQHEEHSLRSVNYRLKNTPVKQLPKILPYITAQLVAGKCRLSNHTDTTWLKAKASSLLQDRTQEGRWAAVVLIKTILELGSPAIFYDDKDRVAAWIRGLIDIIKKPGLATTKQCAIIAVTRAFMLTWDHQTLVREFTTPNLTTFISICLQQVTHGSAFPSTHLQSALIGPILGAFEQLLPRHLTLFRSYSTQIQNITRSVLYKDPLYADTKLVLPEQVRVLASRVLVLLHQCAPKGAGGKDWETGIIDLIHRMHVTMDQIFRAVVEDWQSTTNVRSSITNGGDASLEPQETMKDQANIPEWVGLRSGIQRVKSQFLLLESYLAVACNASVKVPVGSIVDLLSRVLQIHPYAKGLSGGRSNPIISKEEREEFFAVLPGIHVSALELCLTLLQRLSSSSMSLCTQLLDLLTWMFESESFDPNVRLATYRCLALILLAVGQTLDKMTMKGLSKIIKACSTDLLPIIPTAPPTEVTRIITEASSKISGPVSGPVNDHSNITSQATAQTALRKAAHDLLPILLAVLPAELVPRDIRNVMDRTAILINHTDAMAASVLNPVPGKPSILPLLTTLSPSNAKTEAILRPRVPVICGSIGKNNTQNLDVSSESETSGEDENKELEEVPELDEEAQEAELRPQAWDPIRSRTTYKEEQQRLDASRLSQRDEEPEAAQWSAQHESESDTQKRGLVEGSELVGVAKRPRLDKDISATMDVQTNRQRAQPPPTTPLVETAVPVDAQVGSDGDESDFEIPELVMKSDIAGSDSDTDNV